jgi:hypothetical protein
MARVTGAVDGFGSPLVFDTDVSLDDLSAAILSGITTTTTLPVDISLSTSSLPSGLAFSFAPLIATGISPGGNAPFEVALDAGGAAINGTFDLNFIDVSSDQVLGTIPVGVSCSDPSHAVVAIVKTTNAADNDTAPGLSVLAGSTVTWVYAVTNTGNVPLTNVTVSDDKVGTICTIGTLAPGASTSCTKSGTAVAGAYENTGTVTGMPPVGPPVTASNVDHYFGALPGIAIVKTTNGTNNDAGPGPSILGGSTVTWTYLVRNTGNVALTNVTVTDDKVGAICTVGMLAVGASKPCTASRIAVAGQYTNVGTATGTPPVGPAVTASDSDHYFGVESGTFFVIGDVEKHRIGDEVNFWGAQWWKNNQMSGLVTPGVASFKGYALHVVQTGDCGGTWTTRPGNSPPPPAVIPQYVAIIVTDTVVKSGPDIKGAIKEILVVRQDGGYGPNPGHRGNGRVISSVCQ